MNPPIPEPMAVPHTTERGPRPDSLKFLLLIETWFWIVGEFIPAPSESFVESVVLYTISAGNILIYWFLWHGKNWARLLLIGINIFMLLLLLVMETLPFTIGLLDKAAAGAFMKEIHTEETRLERYFIFAHSAFSIVWLFWLQSSPMKAFCLPSKAQ